MIKIILGDVTKPVGDGNKVIVHCCNDVNSFASGVAGSIAKAWPRVKNAYHSWAVSNQCILGQIQFVKAENGITVCNLIGQRDIGGFTIDGVFIPPVRYEAIREGLYRVRDALNRAKVLYGEMPSLHLPLLGSALAGGRWQQIYWLIREVFDDSFNITIYAFDNTNLALANDAHNSYESVKHLTKGSNGS